jgi:hypothetical protein
MKECLWAESNEVYVAVSSSRAHVPTEDMIVLRQCQLWKAGRLVTVTALWQLCSCLSRFGLISQRRTEIAYRIRRSRLYEHFHFTSLHFIPLGTLRFLQLGPYFDRRGRWIQTSYVPKYRYKFLREDDFHTKKMEYAISVDINVIIITYSVVNRI